MILDYNQVFSLSQALTSGTTASTNVLDMGVASNLFDGLELSVLVIINVSAYYVSADETYEFKVLSSATSNMASPTVLADKTVNGNILVAGGTYKLILAIGQVQQALEFLGLSYVLAGTSPTITVSAYLVPNINIDKFTAYKNASLID